MKWLAAIVVEKLISALVDWLERFLKDKQEDKQREIDLEKAKKVLKEVRDAKTKEDTRDSLNKLP